MHADKVEVSWDAAKHKWLVRITAGLEVIRRYCNQPQQADQAALHAAAQQTVTDEGYEFDPARIAILR